MKHCRFLTLYLVHILFLTGCWDRMEIEDRSTVLGLAVDIAEEEQDDPIHHPDDEEIPTSGSGLIEVTAQLAVPGQIPLGPSQGGGGKGPLDSVWVVKAVGHTLGEAVNNLQQQLSSTLFLGHLKIFIISNEVAQNGIEEIIDFMKRHPEIRRDAWLLVNGKLAKETLKAAPRLERIPALYLSSMLDNSIKMGKLPKVRVGKFWIALENDGQDGYLPYIEVKSKDNIQISGIGYFNGDKLVGQTKPYQIAYLNGLIGHNPGGSKAVAKISNDQSIIFESNKRKTKYKLKLRNGKPYFQVNVEVKGNIVGKNNDDFNINRNSTLNEIEKKLERMLIEEFEKLLKETQEKQSDIFGFGEYVRGDLRSYWDEKIKTPEKWREVYKTLPIEVNAKVKIEGIGLRST